MTNASQEKNTFRNRRRMAWWSFTLLCLCGIIMLICILSSDAMAARANSASWAITGLFGVWTTIVLAYFGASSADDIWSPK